MTDVYAVKTENSNEWEALGSIGNFDYEEGNEYQFASARPATLTTKWANQHGLNTNF